MPYLRLTGNTWYFDCDDTLVVWEAGCIEPTPHEEHILLVKKAKARGHTVVIWSAGGAEWAEKVVKMLKLDDYVDLVISKPTWFVDDLKGEQFMPEQNRIYIDSFGIKK